jgi:hypothetical protein
MVVLFYLHILQMNSFVRQMETIEDSSYNEQSFS